MEIENLCRKSASELAGEIIRKLPSDRVANAVQSCLGCDCKNCSSCRKCCNGKGKGTLCPDWLPW